MNEHVHPTIKAVLDQFDPLAMADRFKAATEPQGEPTSQELAMTMSDTYDLLMKLQPSNEREWEQIYGARVMLRHIIVWLEGEHDDTKLLDLLRVNIEGTHKRLEKLEAQL
jgi:hypothetical protein